MLETGIKAPAFELPDQNGTIHTLEEYSLPFTLLSDQELTAIRAYDVWQEKKNYGKVSMGVVRTTYLIDEEGVIVRAIGKVKAADNPQQMLGELE